MISDVDEIPNLNQIDFNIIGDEVYAFSLNHYMYKLNLKRQVMWIGNKLCKKKYLNHLNGLGHLRYTKNIASLGQINFFPKLTIQNLKLLKIQVGTLDG